MSESNAPKGPSEPMVILTKVMRPGPARVSRIAGKYTLPRSVEVPTAIAAGSGALLGMGLIVMLGGGFFNGLYGAIIGGALGWFAMTYSPLEDETLMKWLGLTLKSKTNQVTWQGQKVQVSIGICPIEPPQSGPARIAPGAVNVPASQYDRRGVRISAANRNLDEAESSLVWVGDPTGGGFVGAGRPAPNDWLEAAAAQADALKAHAGIGGGRRRIKLPDLDEPQDSAATAGGTGPSTPGAAADHPAGGPPTQPQPAPAAASPGSSQPHSAAAAGGRLAPVAPQGVDLRGPNPSPVAGAVPPRAPQAPTPANLPPGTQPGPYGVPGRPGPQPGSGHPSPNLRGGPAPQPRPGGPGPAAPVGERPRS